MTQWKTKVKLLTNQRVPSGAIGIVESYSNIDGHDYAIVTFDKDIIRVYLSELEFISYTTTPNDI